MNISEAFNLTINNTAVIECIEMQTLAGRALILSLLFLVLGIIVGMFYGAMYERGKKKKGKGKGLRGKGCKGNLSIT